MPAPKAAPPVEPIRLEAGDHMPEATAGPLSRTDIVRFAGAGGDLNPLHHDEEAARAAGFDSIFAMGMFPAALLENRLARWVGPGNVRRLTVRFVGQVWPGDELLITGRVESVETSPAGGTAEISLRMAADGGEREVTRGSALVTVAGGS